MRRHCAALGALLALAACGPADSSRPAPAAPAPPIPVPGSAAVPGAGGPIQGQNAHALIARFGQPQIDFEEGSGRKLQFLGPQCVLDAYLYPPASGRGDPVVRHVDARRRNGAPVDQASCIAALTRPAPTTRP